MNALSDLLARGEAGDDGLGGKAGEPRRRRGELLEQPLLVGGDQIGVHRLVAQNVRKIAHCCPEWEAAASMDGKEGRKAGR